MKMKKVVFGFLVMTLVFVGSVFAYAGDASDEIDPVVEITSDFDMESEKISTFDDEKTISGTAPSGTMIEISISSKNFAGKLKQTQFYTIEVGVSEIFSQSVELKLGENLVEFSANIDEECVFECETTVNRKKRSIKVQLEKGIYIPGGTYN